MGLKVFKLIKKGKGHDRNSWYTNINIATAKLKNKMTSYSNTAFKTSRRCARNRNKTLRKKIFPQK